MEASVEVAIHLCLLACAHPQEKLAKRAPGEVAIHLCQMASAHPQETRTTSIFREAPGEVAIHLCLLASAHPQEELFCWCHDYAELAAMSLASLFHATFIDVMRICQQFRSVCSNVNGRTVPVV